MQQQDLVYACLAGGLGDEAKKAAEGGELVGAGLRYRAQFVRQLGGRRGGRRGGKMASRKGKRGWIGVNGSYRTSAFKKGHRHTVKRRIDSWLRSAARAHHVKPHYRRIKWKR